MVVTVIDGNITLVSIQPLAISNWIIERDGWLPPSLISLVHNIDTWVKRLCKFAPIAAISQELVRFDTQLMQNPQIHGLEYQQGTFAGYETRE